MGMSTSMSMSFRMIYPYPYLSLSLSVVLSIPIPIPIRIPTRTWYKDRAEGGLFISFRSQFGNFHFSVFRPDNVVLVNVGQKNLFWSNLAKNSSLDNFGRKKWFLTEKTGFGQF